MNYYNFNTNRFGIVYSTIIYSTYIGYISYFSSANPALQVDNIIVDIIHSDLFR